MNVSKFGGEATGQPRRKRAPCATNTASTSARCAAAHATADSKLDNGSAGARPSGKARPLGSMVAPGSETTLA